MQPKRLCIEIGADIFKPLLASFRREKPLLEFCMCVFIGEIRKLHRFAVRPVARLSIPAAKRSIPCDDSEARQIASVTTGLQDNLPSELMPCIIVFFVIGFYFLHS